MNNDVFILPFPSDPPLKSYNFMAYSTGILSTGVHKNVFKEWLYGNYTQLVWSYDTNEQRLRFDKSFFSPTDLPLKHGLFHIHMSQISMIMDDWLHEAFKKSLELGYYVTGDINERYVPNRGSFQKQDFYQNYLIYGYDNNKKVYHMAGCNDKRQFVLTEIPLDLFFDGITSRPIDEHIVIYTFKSDETKQLSYSFKKVCDDLSNYYYGIGENNKYFYGLNVYEHFYHSLNRIYMDNNENFDIRYFYLMYEHKKLMKEKIEYAATLGYLLENQSYSKRYDEMATDFLTAYDLCIQQSITGNVKKESIKSIIEKTAVNEKKLINELLNSI